MTLGYDRPEIHEVGKAAELVQGSKDIGEGDSGTSPFRHDAMVVEDDE
jgi:hypothetical protein